MTSPGTLNNRKNFLRRVGQKMTMSPLMENYFFIGASDVQANGLFYTDTVFMGSAPAALGAANEMLCQIRDGIMRHDPIPDELWAALKQVEAAISALGVRRLEGETVQ